MYMRVFIFHSGINTGETFYICSFSAKDVRDGWAICVSSSPTDLRALRSRMHLYPSSQEMQQEL